MSQPHLVSPTESSRSTLPLSIRSSAESSVGARLRHEREVRGMSLEEISRATRIPYASLEHLEHNHFDHLPGEVFVRGFLRSYARALNVEPDEILAQYSSLRRVPYVTPVPISQNTLPRVTRKRVGVAVAFVLLFVLCTMAISFVLKPRGRDLPAEVSSHEAAVSLSTLRA